MTQEWISEFRAVNEDEWKAQLLKELKGDESKLVVYNKIEEISYSTFHYPNEIGFDSRNSASLTVQRGFYKSHSQWRNGIQISTENEQEANKTALNALMAGCDFIHFISTKKTNWNEVLNEIGLEYIHTTFTIEDSSNFSDLINVIGQDNLRFCSFNLTREVINFNEIKDLINVNQLPVIQIDGFSFNQCGANTIQELGFVIEKAHAALVDLMNLGLTIDEAAACIHFRIGVGANYLIEIAKFRALKILWANLVKAYNPQHNCSLNCQITAEVGWVNKSLKDPHTNLLRQTTEAMSAILGGIDRLIIHPYDYCSVKGPSDLAQRMALNISNLLQDESYLATVSDALGGSYAIELLTNELAEKGWNLFKKMDVLYPESQNEEWKKLVKSKVLQRIEMLKSSELTLIGINKFLNPEKIDNKWAEAKSFLGMPFLRLETEF
jgi:methylmalonyl-CoA mutase